MYAVRELNDKGGLLGRKVELLIEDDQAKPELSATSARKLSEARRGLHPVDSRIRWPRCRRRR